MYLKKCKNMLICTYMIGGKTVGILKNDVGRPSNKVIKIRRIMLGSFVIALVSSIIIGVNYVNDRNNIKNLKGAALQIVKPDASGVYFERNEISSSNNSIFIKEIYYMYGDVYNSQHKKVGYDRIINDDDVSYIEKNLNIISNSKDSLVKKLADVNHDGKINTNDVNLIKRMSNSQSKIYGDLDGDKTITYKDKKLLYKYLNAKAIFKSNQRKLADIDGNGRVNKTDYHLMLYRPAYVYCLSTSKIIHDAKKSCTWYQAGKPIKIDNRDYYLYKLDLSNDEIVSKGLYSNELSSFDYEKYLKNYISEFNSDYFGITNNPGKGEFLLEKYNGKTFKFKNYILSGRIKDIFYGEKVEDIFTFQIVNVSNNKVIYDSLKGSEFDLSASKTYNLKLRGTIKENGKKQTIESKTVKIRLLNDGTYVKNSVIGKSSEILFLLESYAKKNIILSKSVIYQKGSLIQSRGSIDTIVIPNGFNFSNLEAGALDIYDNKTIKIINKTGEKVDWKVFADSNYQIQSKANTEKCVFETGTCKYDAGTGFDGDDIKTIIVTNQ